MLMLANMYIGTGKYDLAEDLCRRCLSYNQGCGLAHERMGLIKEKEASYADAALHYEQAWVCENELSPVIGFKLAFNYLKAQRYIDAVEVCNKVLGKFPNYPKMKTEILAKAWSGLRP